MPALAISCGVPIGPVVGAVGGGGAVAATGLGAVAGDLLPLGGPPGG